MRAYNSPVEQLYEEEMIQSLSLENYQIPKKTIMEEKKLKNTKQSGANQQEGSG